jgi:general secretion pathway protein G
MRKNWHAALVLTAALTFMAACADNSADRARDRARSIAARAEILSLMRALDVYKLDTGAFPTTEQGLKALREQPADAGNWNGPYVARDVPSDPWGHDYIYRYPGTHGADPEIVSYGADGKPGGEGKNADIVSWGVSR